jgi:hypothetical protein
MRARKALGLIPALALGAAMLTQAAPAQAQHAIDDAGSGATGDYDGAFSPVAESCRKDHPHANGVCKGLRHSHKDAKHRVQTKAELVDDGDCDLLDVSGDLTLCQAFDIAKRRAKTGADLNKSSDGVVGLWWGSFTQKAFSYEWWQLNQYEQYNSHQGAQGWFDGVHVWFDSSRAAPHPGFHQCWADRALVVDVHVTHCWEQWARDGNGDTFVRVWDEFQTNVIIRGVPLWNNIYMHTNFHDDGAMTFWLSDVNADGKSKLVWHNVKTRFAK